ncbi:cadmium-translocating P-type ATPase [Candidatus Woesearchaeota archaeon]|nr:cadmium-translocating P-type ATPase [Candidatus Woesearchaeota archaeon]
MIVTATDPVCGMQVDKDLAQKKGLSIVKDGKSSYFCSERCKNEYEQRTGQPRAEHPGHAAANTVYTCPMHPNVRRDKPGLCPECGMQLVPGKAKEEYDKHAGHSPNIFKMKFWISLFLTVPVVIYSGVLEELFGVSAPAFPGSAYVPLILGSIIFFYGGWVFLIGGYRETRAKLPGMMTLIAIAIIAAYSYSVYAVFAGVPGLFWELTTLITIMLLGHWMEMRAVQGSQKALKELAKLLPDTAEVLRGKQTVTVPLTELKKGDLVLVRPGAKVPADGVVAEGESDVDEALITGESKPVLKKAKSQVIAGSVNGDGSLTVKITSIGEKTFLSGIMRLVQEAQASKSRIQVLSDKAAFLLTIVAVVAGGATLVSWIVAKAGVGFAMERFVSVLVIACPHALGLAVPLVATISTTLSARNGLLVKQRLALEAARNIDIVVFDKTGTLTTGAFGVVGIDGDDDKALSFAAAVDRHSEHPIAKALVHEAEARKLKLPTATAFKRLPGVGAQAKLGRTLVKVGTEKVLEGIRTKPKELPGQTLVYVVAGKKLIGVIGLADKVREESRQAIKDLNQLGVKVAMLTGDTEDVAKAVAADIGIDQYFARVKPDEKAEKVKLLQSQGSRVAMVGDGINDAPALTQADVGIAIGAGTNVAIESAGIILVRNDPRDVVKIIRLSRLTYRKMIQNLWWASGYNIIAIPLAAGVLSSQGILLQPAVGALFMSFSTVIVAINASLLWKAKL